MRLSQVTVSLLLQGPGRRSEVSGCKPQGARGLEHMERIPSSPGGAVTHNRWMCSPGARPFDLSRVAKKAEVPKRSLGFLMLAAYFIKALSTPKAYPCPSCRGYRWPPPSFTARAPHNVPLARGLLSDIDLLSESDPAWAQTVCSASWMHAVEEWRQTPGIHLLPCLLLVYSAQCRLHLRAFPCPLQISVSSWEKFSWGFVLYLALSVLPLTWFISPLSQLHSQPLGTSPKFYWLPLSSHLPPSLFSVLSKFTFQIFTELN